jgi:hypothetical protein
MMFRHPWWHLRAVPRRPRDQRQLKLPVKVVDVDHPRFPGSIGTRRRTPRILSVLKNGAPKLMHYVCREHTDSK